MHVFLVYRYIYFVVIFSGMIYLFMNEGQQSVEVTLYRASNVFICFLGLFFPVMQVSL
jgi:hypothetical protein